MISKITLLELAAKYDIHDAGEAFMQWNKTQAEIARLEETLKDLSVLMHNMDAETLTSGSMNYGVPK